MYILVSEGFFLHKHVENCLLCAVGFQIDPVVCLLNFSLIIDPREKFIIF